MRAFAAEAAFLDAADVAGALASRDGRIAELEAEVAALKDQQVSSLDTTHSA